MGRKIIVVLILFFINIEIIAQPFQFSPKYLAIKNYRDNIINYLNKDMIDSIVVKRFFELQDNENVYLRFEEEEALLLIIGQYNLLINDLNKRDAKFSSVNKLRVLKNRNEKDVYRIVNQYFNSDALSERIKKYFEKNKNLISDKILLSKLSDEDKAYVQLIFDYYLTLFNPCASGLENKTIKKANEFLKIYPESDYNRFVKDYMAVEYKESNWSGGVYLYGEVILLTQELRDYFEIPILFDFSFEMSYRRFQWNFGFSGNTLSHLKKNLPEGYYGNKDDEYDFFKSNTTLGYQAIKSRNINITPFVGLSFPFISVKHNTDNDLTDLLNAENPFFYGLSFQ